MGAGLVVEDEDDESGGVARDEGVDDAVGRLGEAVRFEDGDGARAADGGPVGDRVGRLFVVGVDLRPAGQGAEGIEDFAGTGGGDVGGDLRAGVRQRGGDGVGQREGFLGRGSAGNKEDERREEQAKNGFHGPPCENSRESSSLYERNRRGVNEGGNSFPEFPRRRLGIGKLEKIRRATQKMPRKSRNV